MNILLCTWLSWATLVPGFLARAPLRKIAAGPAMGFRPLGDPTTPDEVDSSNRNRKPLMIIGSRSPQPHPSSRVAPPDGIDL